MKNFVFIVTHHYSGESELRQIMNNNPRLVINSSSSKYDHPDVLEQMMKNHKLGASKAAVFGDTLLYNHSFSSKSLYKACKFLYLIREPRPVLNQLVLLGMPIQNAYMYYSFRLRRICEMAKQTPEAIFLTYNDLKEAKGFDLIYKDLNLREPLSLDGIKFSDDPVDSLPFETMQKAQDCFERHFYYLNNLNLQRAK